MVGLFSSPANKLSEAIPHLSKEIIPLQESPPARPAVSPRVSKEKEHKIVEGYRAGRTVYELADKFGIHRITVGEVLKRAGVTMRRQAPTNEQLQEMVILYESGMALLGVGKRTGFSPTTVRKYLLGAGVRIRDSHGRP